MNGASVKKVCSCSVAETELLASKVSFVAEGAWAAVSFFPLSLLPKKVEDKKDIY